jgi:hypothetical protein
VRIAQTARRYRAHQRRDSAQPRRARRPARAVTNRLIVGHERRVIENDLAFHAAFPQFLEFVEIGDRDHVGGDPIRRRRHASAEAEHEERFLQRLQHLGRFAPAHPMRNLHRDGTNICESGLLHLFGAPRDRLVESRRSTQPVADPVAQVFEAVQPGFIGQRRVDQLVGSVLISGGIHFVIRRKTKHGEPGKHKNWQQKHAPSHRSMLARGSAK